MSQLRIVCLRHLGDMADCAVEDRVWCEADIRQPAHNVMRAFEESALAKPRKA
jgi:hypothetical protein